jgi:sulfur-oxidizing protein SoxY
MNHSRREALKAGGGASLLALLAAAGVIRPGEVLAAEWNKTAFEMKTLADALRALGAQSATTSEGILIIAPDIAENSAVVRIVVESKLPGTESITLLIEKNPQPLAASFGIPPGTEANVSTRVKMAQTSDVYALVKADGRFYVAKKEVKITIGGCGG